MQFLKKLAFLAPAFALASLTAAPEARACGACFHGESENTQVTGHRMIFSVSPSATTLWDQITYAGDPSSWAWVLPIKGSVEIGLSSDALFELLLGMTTVTVMPPPLNCPGRPYCPGETSTSTATFSSGADGGSVTVVAQSVVGPYETVQLHSTDPNALSAWLTDHGYVLPTDFAPTVSAYVSEGFDFLALKLVPGQGVTSMKPVRVTTPGAGATLPLRMVAGGVGVSVPITLWVLGQGRYQPANFPWFAVDPELVVWDFATSSSNYAQLRQAGFDASQGKSWQVEWSNPASSYSVSSTLSSAVTYDPQHSGYGDENGNGAQADLDADMAKLTGTIPEASLWLTRLHAELPRAALANDLTLGAASAQTAVAAIIQAKHAVNVPLCPSYPPCANTGGAGGDGSGYRTSGGCDVGPACAAGQTRDGDALGVLAAALGLTLAWRRRRR